MIVLILVIAAFMASIFFLKGEGDHYAGNPVKKRKGKVLFSHKGYMF